MAIVRDRVANYEEVISMVNGNGNFTSSVSDETPEVSAVSAEEKSTGRTEANEYLANYGYHLLQQEENVEELGKDSGTLHFVTLLGLASKPTVRKINGRNVTCPTTIGVTLVSDKQIEVPVIDPRKNKDTGINPERDISYRTVPAGEEFHLNMYELMYLIIRNEYGGFLSYKGDPKGVYFAPKVAKFHRGESKMPTPVLAFKPAYGAIKDVMIPIDEKVNGEWRIKDKYRKEFGALEKEMKSRRSAIRHIPNQTAIAVALQERLLGGRQKSH
jgi:hypothetical protein